MISEGYLNGLEKWKKRYIPENENATPAGELMRLNPDILRLLLLEAEREEDVANQLKKYKARDLSYHNAQLMDAGYLHGKSDWDRFGEYYRVSVYDLTWKGHELLANIRNPEIYEKTKSHIKEKSDSASIAILGELAGRFVRGFLGIEGP